MMQEPHNVIRLEAGELVCELRAELGGCIAGLWFRGVPVLRSTLADQLASVRQAGSYPLVPFSNRLGQATQTQLGVTVLAPGESVTAQMSIEVETANA